MKKLTRKSAKIENGIQAYSWCGLSWCICLEGMAGPGYGGISEGVQYGYRQRSQGK